MVYQNSKRVNWYSSTRMVTIGRNKMTVPVYFFRKEKKNDYVEKLPDNMTVIETSTGLPFVKRI